MNGAPRPRARPGRGRGIARVLAAAWLAVAGGRAFAADEGGCVALPGGGALTVLGVGRVVFTAFATDRSRDAASFDGEVCVEAVDGAVVVRASGLEVSGLSGAVRWSATDVVVDVAGWSLAATGLVGGVGRIDLRDAVIRGSDAVGLADALRLDLEDGSLEAERLRLATASIRLDAQRARLDGAVLWGDGVVLSSCDCPPEEAPLRLEAADARFDLERESLRVGDGVLVVDGRRLALPDPFGWTPALLADLRFPVEVGPDPERAGAWRLRLVRPEGGEDPDVSAALTFDGATPVQAVVAGQATEGPATLRWTFATDGLEVDVRGGTSVGDGWRVDAGQRFEAGRPTDPVRDTWVRVGGTAGGGSSPWSARYGATAALTGQTVAGAEVAGPRLAVDAQATRTWAEAPGAPSWTVSGGASTYPGLGRAQAWFAVRPALAFDLGGLRVGLVHEGRWVLGTSPFSERVDRVVPVQRSELLLRWPALRLAGGSAEASLTARYRWDADPLRPGRPIGVEALTVALAWQRPVGTGRLALDLELALAGRLDPRPDRDAFARATVAWTEGRWELGGRTTVGLRAGEGLRELTLFAAVPVVASPTWWWRPYVAIDAFAFAGGPGPWLRGHGLDVAWRGCCGTIEVGYRSDLEGETTTRLVVQLPTRALDPARLAEAR